MSIRPRQIVFGIATAIALVVALTNGDEGNQPTKSVAPPPATAAEKHEKAEARAEKLQDSKERCESLHRSAKHIMKARQEGQSMVKRMNLASGDKTLKQMVMSAYDKPRMMVKRNQRQMTEDFSNDVYLGCMQKVRKLERRSY